MEIRVLNQIRTTKEQSNIIPFGYVTEVIIDILYKNAINPKEKMKNSKIWISYLIKNRNKIKLKQNKYNAVHDNNGEPKVPGIFYKIKEIIKTAIYNIKHILEQILKYEKQQLDRLYEAQNDINLIYKNNNSNYSSWKGYFLILFKKLQPRIKICIIKSNNGISEENNSLKFGIRITGKTKILFKFMEDKHGRKNKRLKCIS